MSDVHWFRAPTDGDAGTLNACYDALDIHVVRGHADDVALTDPDGDWTFARLLTDVAACGGVLRAFGVTVGDHVALGDLPRATGVVVALAVARLGAVAAYDDSAAADATMRVGEGGTGVVFGVEGEDEDVPWDIAMRAGRTDPAPCAEVPGDAILARHGADELPVLAALGASDDHDLPVPAGASVVEVGGLRLWSFDPAQPLRGT
ncbi:AMP-binding protein [Nocardia sp. N13]|uniref:AMP-binding protein n=1 Tax=Nocardioides sp. N13(2025) TaxID=3453405 RepID=UPI003F76E723